MKKLFHAGILVCLITCLSSCGGGTSTTSDTGTLSNGLVVHYAFDETSGTNVTDSSDNNISGTVIGAAEWASGIIGNALQFDGTDDYVQIPNQGEAAPSAVSSLSTGSISLWFKYTDPGTTGILLPIFYVGPSSDVTGTSDGLLIEVGHSGISERETSRQLFFTLTSESVDPDSDTHIPLCFDSLDNLTSGEWYHFVVIVTESGNTGYLNGSEMTNRNYNFGNSSSSYFFDDVGNGIFSIGYGRFTGDQSFHYFKGAIDDVRVYNRELTAAEVTELYQLGNQ